MGDKLLSIRGWQEGLVSIYFYTKLTVWTRTTFHFLTCEMTYHIKIYACSLLCMFYVPLSQPGASGKKNRNKNSIELHIGETKSLFNEAQCIEIKMVRWRRDWGFDIDLLISNETQVKQGFRNQNRTTAECSSDRKSHGNQSSCSWHSDIT